MDLKEFLAEKRPAIVKRWFDYVLETYPVQTSELLKSGKSRFTNPVGNIISESLASIFDELVAHLGAEGLEPGGADRLGEFLENVIRVRAVQDFTASGALGFIFSLKKAVMEEAKGSGSLNSQPGREEFYRQMMEFGALVDRLALGAFDFYMQCKEKIYELKAVEVRSHTYRLLQQANLLVEKKEEEEKGKSPSGGKDCNDCSGCGEDQKSKN